MKILATFDGSALSESILPQLEMLGRLPDVEFVLLRIARTGHGQQRSEAESAIGMQAPAIAGGGAVVVDGPKTGYAETKDQATERSRAEASDYLHAIAQRLPEGARWRAETVVDDHPQSAIVRYALHERPALIVMATHGESGLIHVLFGDVAESVVRSGVAPVLLVQPNAVAAERGASG
jgi:nucleotide-binding universal stress UspA family protein